MPQRLSFIPVISVPPSRTGPADGRSSPAAHWMKVDLPEPDGPTIAVNVPRGRARSRPHEGVHSTRAATVPPPHPAQLDGGTGCGVREARPVARRVLLAPA